MLLMSMHLLHIIASDAQNSKESLPRIRNQPQPPHPHPGIIQGLTRLSRKNLTAICHESQSRPSPLQSLFSPFKPLPKPQTLVLSPSSYRGHPNHSRSSRIHRRRHYRQHRHCHRPRRRRRRHGRSGGGSGTRVGAERVPGGRHLLLTESGPSSSRQVVWEVRLRQIDSDLAEELVGPQAVVVPDGDLDRVDTKVVEGERGEDEALVPPWVARVQDGVRAPLRPLAACVRWRERRGRRGGSDGDFFRSFFFLFCGLFYDGEREGDGWTLSSRCSIRRPASPSSNFRYGQSS